MNRCPRCNARNTIQLDEEGDPHCWCCGKIFTHVPDSIIDTMQHVGVIHPSLPVLRKATIGTRSRAYA